jgi:hypothetical protein
MLGHAEGDQSPGFLFDQRNLNSGLLTFKSRQITGASDWLGVHEEVGEKEHAVLF